MQIDFLNSCLDVIEGLAIGCLLGVLTYIVTRVVAIPLGDFNSTILILPLSATTGTIVF